MLDSTINNNPVIRNSYPGVPVPTGDPVKDAVSTTLVVDAVMLENEINHMKRKSGHVEAMTQQKKPEASPQLTPPAVIITSDENDAASLKSLLAALGQAQSDGSVDLDELQSRLLSLLGGSEEDIAELKRSWEVFEAARAELLSARAEIEEVMALLEAFQAIPNPSQEEKDKLTKLANDAFVNMNKAMAGLTAAVDALLVSGDQGQLDLINQVMEDMNNLNWILIKLQKVMKASNITLIQENADLYKRQQDSLSTKLLAKANDIKETMEKQKVFADVMKGVGIALAVLLAAVTGGGLTSVTGLLSMAFMAIDLSTGSVMSEALLTPITEAVTPMIEALVANISEAMIADGYDETTAMIVAAITTVVAVAVAAAAVAGILKVVGDAANKVVAMALAKDVVQKFLKDATELVTPMVDKLKTVASPLTDAAGLASKKMDSRIHTALGKMQHYVDVNLNKIHPSLPQPATALIKVRLDIDGCAEYLTKRLAKTQLRTMLAGTAIEAGLTIALSDLGKDEKRMESDITMTETDHDVITKEITKENDRWTEKMPAEENFMKLATKLQESQQRTASYIYHGLPA